MDKTKTEMKRMSMVMKGNGMLRLMVVAFCLLSSIFNLHSSMCSAQSIQFYYHGEPLENRDTITIETEEDDFGALSCETNPAGNPQNGLMLKNLTANKINGKALMTITKNTLTDKPKTWCMGGLCETFTDNKFNKDFSIHASNAVSVMFDVTPTQYGELLASLEARVNLTEVVRVYVRMVYKNPDDAGISVLSDDTGKSGSWLYDLSGRRIVGQPAQGVYMKGGKKYVNKK